MKKQPYQKSQSIMGVGLFAFALFGFALMTFGNTSSAKAEEEPFVLEYPDLTLDKGKETAAPVTLKPKAGWKWNLEYPASAEVSVEGPCETSTAQLGKSGKEIEVKGKDVVFPVSLKGNSSGSAQIKVTASFSICNEESCKIFRKRDMKFAVKIK